MSSKDVEDVDLTPPDAVQNAAQAAIDFEEENDDIEDCGTGVGDMRAEQIVNNDLEPEDFLGGENTAIPDYLDSHEEDVTAEGPATDWSQEEMDDCGNRQYAKWGGTGTGTGLEWAQNTEEELREAMEDEDDEETNAMKSYDYNIGDFVSWEFGDGESQGEIVDRTDEEGDSMSAGGNEFTVDDSTNPLYKIQEWDEEEGEDGEFTNLVVKFEESVSSAERPEDAPETAPQNRSKNTMDSEQVKTPEAEQVKNIKSFDFAVASKDVKIEEVDGHKLVKVPVQAPTEDRDGDIVTESGQEAAIEQFRSGQIGAFPNHGYGESGVRYDYTEMMGQYVDAEQEDGVTMATLRLRNDDSRDSGLDKYAEELVDLLEQDMPVGFSIGFIPTDTEEREEGRGYKIHDMDLMECSPVGIPSNPMGNPQALSAGDQMAIAAKGAVEENGLDPDAIGKSIKNELKDTMGDEPEEDGKDQNHSKAKNVKDKLKSSLKDLEKFDEEELQEIMAVVGETIQMHMDEAMDDIADELAMEEDEEDSSDGDDEEDDDDEEDMSADDGDGDTDDGKDDEPDEEDGLDDDEKTVNDSGKGKTLSGDDDLDDKTTKDGYNPEPKAEGWGDTV